MRDDRTPMKGYSTAVSSTPGPKEWTLKLYNSHDKLVDTHKEKDYDKLKDLGIQHNRLSSLNWYSII